MEDWAEQNCIPKQVGRVNSDDLESFHKTSGLPRRVSSIIPELNEISMFVAS
jgi:neutral ceramidase